MNNEPEVGQVWEDCDPRMPQRRVRINRIEGAFAYVQNLKGHRPETRIRLTRLRPTSTGYRLVVDGLDGAPK